MRTRITGQEKWLILAACALGLIVFQALGLGMELVASSVDRVVYTQTSSTVREVLIRYRVWELYRALFNSVSAALCGWMVATVFASKRAVLSVALTIAASLLISLFTGPGYYLRDAVLVGVIAISPMVGAEFVRRSAVARTDGLIESAEQSQPDNRR